MAFDTLWFDQYQLNSDFEDFRKILREVRHEAFISKATFEILFEGKTVKVENKKTADETYRIFGFTVQLFPLKESWLTRRCGVDEVVQKED